MSKTIKVALAGAGAFGIKHLDAIKLIDGVEVISLISRACSGHSSGVTWSLTLAHTPAVSRSSSCVSPNAPSAMTVSPPTYAQS